MGKPQTRTAINHRAVVEDVRKATERQDLRGKASAVRLAKDALAARLKDISKRCAARRKALSEALSRERAQLAAEAARERGEAKGSCAADRQNAPERAQVGRAEAALIEMRKLYRHGALSDAERRKADREEMKRRGITPAVLRREQDAQVENDLEAEQVKYWRANKAGLRRSWQDKLAKGGNLSLVEHIHEEWARDEGNQLAAIAKASEVSEREFAAKQQAEYDRQERERLAEEAEAAARATAKRPPPGRPASKPRAGGKTWTQKDLDAARDKVKRLAKLKDQEPRDEPRNVWRAKSAYYDAAYDLALAQHDQIEAAVEPRHFWASGHTVVTPEKMAALEASAAFAKAEWDAAALWRKAGESETAFGQRADKVNASLIATEKRFDAASKALRKAEADAPF